MVIGNSLWIMKNHSSLTKEWKVSHDSSCEMKRGLYLNLEMILAFLSLGKWNLFPTCDEHGKKNKTSTAKGIMYAREFNFEFSCS